MNRAARYENARSAVVKFLLNGGAATYAQLLDIAKAELPVRCVTLAQKAVDMTILDRDGCVGDDINIANYDGEVCYELAC